MIRVYIHENGEVNAAEQREICQKMLSDCLVREGIAPDHPQEMGEYGKPYLVGNPLYFNISHSGGYTVIGFSDCEIGLDIQKIKPISKSVCRRFLHTCATDPREQTILWTKYEALGKYLGCGIPYRYPVRDHVFMISGFADIVLSVCQEVPDKMTFIWI